jgi:hypothetical protein
VDGGGAGVDGGGLGSKPQLPACNLQRLVGFKVPAEPWWVGVTEWSQKQ